MTRHKSIVLLALLAALAVCGGGFAADLPDPDGKPADMAKPVQVFILMGQSNMLGFGNVAGGEGSLENAVKNKKLYPYLVDDDGNWTVRKDVRNVRVMCSGNSPAKTYVNDWLSPQGQRFIGVEIGIGHYVGNLLDAPVLILKSCIGNRSLGWDLLPPGSEPYEFDGKMQPGYRGTPDDPKGNGQPVKGKWYAGCQYDGDVAAAKKVLEDLGTYYPGAKNYEVAGFCWWQGDKDFRNKAHSARYEKNLVQFIKSLRKDFNAPNAKFVMATLGQTKKGAGGTQGQIINAMFNLADGSKHPEFKGDVATFYSNPVSKGGSSSGHYSHNAETYMNIGEGMGKAMVELLKAGGGLATSGKKSTTSSAAPGSTAGQAARRLAAGKINELNGMFMKKLVELSNSGNLKPTRVPLTLTRSAVSLVSAKPDNTLTLQSAGGKTATVSISQLKGVDFVNLSILLTQLMPGDKDALAISGAYLECMGHGKLANEKYAQAGEAAKAKIDALFTP